MNEQRYKRKKQNREEPEWVVVVFVIVAVAAGLLLKTAELRRTVEFATETMHFEYPASWIKEVTFSGNAEGATRNVYHLQTVFKAKALRSESPFAPKLAVKKLAITQLGGMNPESSLTEAVTYLTMQYSQNLSHFEVFEIGPREVAGFQGLLMEYSSISEAVSSSVRKSFPIPVYGIDFLIQMESNTNNNPEEVIYLFTYRTSADKVDEAFSELERIIETLSLEGPAREVRS
jgi:hypothetical protein